MRETKVVFDWDGVFNRQVPWLCSKMGLPIPNAYHVGKATNLTPEQKERLFNAYFSPEAYIGVPLVEGVERAMHLPCVPYIYSANTTHEMKMYKYRLIRSLAPYLPESHIVLPDSTEKPPLDDVDIIVEDGLHYLAVYPETTMKILIDYPYNRETTQDVVRVNSLMEALDIIDGVIYSRALEVESDTV